MRTLVKALDHGRAAVVFVIQRCDADEFRPNDAMDPGFGESLRYAASSGVEVYAFSTDVSLRGAEILGRVPVRL